MSYDLHLFTPQPGADPLATALATLEAEGDSLNPGPVDTNREAWKQRLADALIKADPLLEPFHFDYSEIAKLQGLTEDEARRQFRHIELNAPENGNGLQIQLFDDTASVAIPYWHRGAEAEAAWTEIWSCLKTCRAVADLSVYDPQLDQILDLDHDRPAVLEKYSEGVQMTESVAREVESKRPWWKFW